MAKTAKRTTTTKKTDTGTSTAGITGTKRGVRKSSAKTMPTAEQIRQRAYELYLARNGGPGDAHSDWVEAERQLLAELSA